MSNGTLQQLASKGVQDGHLNIAPETSFFKRTYKRISNYAVESIDVEIPSLSWDHNFTSAIPRNGDLLAEMWLLVNINLARLSVPGGDTVRWTNVLGHAMFNPDLSFEVGNNEIHKLYYTYLEILWELTSNINVDLDVLVLRSDSATQLEDWTNNGNTIDTDGNAVTRLYVKLPFWFCVARSQAVPVIALQYHDMRVKFSLRRKTDLLVFSNGANTTLDTTYTGDIRDGALMCNFVFLDSMERRLFASNSHEYLIKNIQVSNYNVKPSGSQKMSARVVFNHPCTTFYWYVQKQSHITNKDYFNFERTDGAGDDTITSATIKLNGAQREKPRGPLYWRKLVPGEYFARTPTRPIYCYTVAAYPSAWWPSGSLNLSRIDVTSLDFTFLATDANGDPFTEADVVIIVDNFNVIRVQGGMMAKKFAN